MSVTIFILNEHERCVGIMDPTLPYSLPYWNDVHHLQLEHGYSTFECEIPADHEQSSLVAVEGFLLVPTFDEQFEKFQIKEIEEIHSDSGLVKRVFCETAAVSELITSIVRPAEYPSIPLTEAATKALVNTDWVLGRAESSLLKDVKFEDYLTSLEAIHQIADTFGMEVYFDCEFNGTQVVKKRVHFVEQRGARINKPFIYGLDLGEVKRTEDSKELVTALIGVGKSDTNGNTLTFSGYQPPSVEAGFEKKDDWVGSLDALQRWGLPGGRHRFGVYQDDKAANPAELYENTLKELKKRCKPRLTYEVKVTVLERLTGYEAHRVRIGDQVLIKDTTFQPELVLEARIMEMKRSRLDPAKDEVTLGEFIPISALSISSIEQLRKFVRRHENGWLDVRDTIGYWRDPNDRLKMNGTQLAQGTVSTDKLTTGTSPNLIVKGYDSFEQMPVNKTLGKLYDAVHCRVVENPALSLDGVKCVELMGGNGPQNVGFTNEPPEDRTPVEMGQTYIASCFVRNPAASSVTVKLTVRLTNPADGNVPSWDASAAAAVSQADGWKRLWVKFTVPTTHTYTHSHFRLEHNGANLPIYFDSFMLEHCSANQTEPSPWKPAGITTIDAGNISSGTLQSDLVLNGRFQLGKEGYNDGHIYIYDSAGEEIAHFTKDHTGITHLQAQSIQCPTIVQYNNKNLTFYVDPVNGVDDTATSGSSSQPFQSISYVIDQKIPKFNDGTITIYVSNNTTENVTLTGYNGNGHIQIIFKDSSGQYGTSGPKGSSVYSLYGSFTVSGCQNRVSLYNCRINCRESSTGTAFSVLKSTYVYVYNGYIFGNDAVQTCKVNDGSFVYFRYTDFFDSSLHGILSQFGARVFVVDCYGYAEKSGCYGMVATNGGVICGYGKCPNGIAGATLATNGGEIVGSFTPENGTNPNSPSVSVTKTWNSTDSQSWRDTYGWRTDNNYVYQGSYGYGNHRGYWFFGNVQASVANKNITKIRFYCQRRASGGNSGPVTVYFRTHDYQGRTTADPPTFEQINEAYAASFSWGEGKWITLPSSMYDNFKTGGANGIGIYTSNTSSSYYAIFEEDAKLEITYDT